MTSKKYKEYKGLRKESRRDNMSDLEVALADIGELTARELAKEKKPQGLEEDKIIAVSGGEVAKHTRNEIESKLGRSVVTKENNIPYKYNEEKQIK